jgi:hypothetical protein
MNFTEFIFFIQLFGFFIILLAKLYNLFTVGKFYDIKISFILFISQVLLFGFGLMVVLTDYTQILFSRLLQWETWFLAFSFLFLLAELFFYWKAKGFDLISAKNSKREREERDKNAA